MDKNTARKRGLASRASLSKEQRQAYDRIIQSQVISLIQDADTIGCYVSINDEVDTIPILAYCFAHNKTICVPKTVKPTLQFQKIHSMNDLKPGTMQIPEPITNEIVNPDDIDLMIVPLSAFDEEGHRTGYGAGYYDSVLNHVRWKVGIAYPEQRMDFIETDPWDVDLDFVITCNPSEKPA